MTLSYIDPLKLAWTRTRLILFAPFQLETWLVLGFAAWTAGLADGMGQSWSDQGLKWTGDRASDVLAGLVAVSIVAGIALVGIVVGVVLLWVGSRAKFVFLDNVVQGRAQIVDPWKGYGRLGDSLFLWRIVFNVLFLVLLVGIGLPFILFAGVGAVAGGSADGVLAGATLLLLVGALVVLAVPYFFVNLLLNDFVVPVMYRRNLTATQAWGALIPVVRENLLYFVLYALFIVALHAALAAVIAVVTLATCCVGGLILAIPYVGTVLLLPVWVTYRAYSLEFLAQFGPDLTVFQGPPEPSSEQAGKVPPPGAPPAP